MMIRFLSRVAKAIEGIIMHLTYQRVIPWKNWCNVCERWTAFVCITPGERFVRSCVRCRSTPKYRAIVKAVEETTSRPLSQHMAGGAKLYELTTKSPICRRYSNLTNYVCSGYFWNKPFGIEIKPRVYNQDCQRLSFPDASFEIAISSETMEHVRKPWVGFSEIHRVLKPGGTYFFTIPYRDDCMTKSRVDVSGTEDVYLLPKIFHDDPYRSEDSLVYTDFGRDLPLQLRPFGFETTVLRIRDERMDIQDDLAPIIVFVAKRVE